MENQKITITKINQLSIWEDNTRKTDVTENINELKASILSVGLLNPLTVFYQVELDMYRVVAGQRRFIALSQLIEEEKLDVNTEINCILVDKKDALEISIAENAIREDMAPIDQYLAFTKLAENGLTAADISGRFGYPEKHIEKMLRLGRVAPELLEDYKAEKMDLDQLQAFTLTDNQAMQRKVWQAIQKQPSWNQDRENIIEMLTQNEIPSTDKRVIFVTLAAYVEAGGEVRKDLFDDLCEAYILNSELLQSLYNINLEAVKKNYLDAGWSWVEIRDDFYYSEKNKFEQEKGRKPSLTPDEKEAYNELKKELDDLYKIEDTTDEQDKRCQQIEARIREIDNRPAVYSKDVMKRSGVVIVVGNRGNLEISAGLLKKADAKKLQKKAAPEEKKDEGPNFPALLIGELDLQRDAALRCELLKRPDLTLVAFVYGLVKEYRGGYLNANVTQHEPIEGTEAARIFNEQNETLAAWGMPEDTYDDDAIWEWLNGLKNHNLLDIVNFYLAFSFNRNLSGSGKLLEKIGEFNMRDYFTPTAENYFSRVKAGQILNDLENMGFIGTDQIKNKKKAELVQIAHDYVQQGLGSSSTWLPEPMRGKDE